MLRRVIYLLLALIFVACSATETEREIVIRSVNPIGEEWQEWQQSGQQGLPQTISLSVQVENAGAGLKIRGGEAELRYGGRKVAILRLQEKVKIMGHRNSQVMLTMRLHVAHNSQAQALYEALRNRSADGISIGWNLKVRKGLFAGRVKQEAMALGELLSEQDMERLWQMMKRFK